MGDMREYDGNGWPTYQKLVLAKLEGLEVGQTTNERRLEQVSVQLQRLEVEVAGLKVKAGVWGALAGTIPALVAAFGLLLHHYLG